MRTYDLFIGLAFAFTVLLSCGRSKDDAPFYTSLSDYLTEPFEIEDIADGDFNNDGELDQVFVVRMNEKKTRKLIVGLGRAADLFEVVVDTEKLILREDEPGYESDPYLILQAWDSKLVIVHTSKENKDYIMEHLFEYDTEQESFWLSSIDLVYPDGSWKNLKTYKKKDVVISSFDIRNN